MSTMTKERAAQIAAGGGFNFDEIAVLARIALASLEAEPVAYMWNSDRKDVDAAGYYRPEHKVFAESSVKRYGGKVVPLYATPPAPVAMKDHQIRELVNELRDISVECHGTRQLRERIARTIRATMLQGVENAETPTTMQTAPAMDYSPKIAESPTGINQGKSEPVTTANKLSFEQWLSQQTGAIDVECGCVMTEVFFHWLRVAYEAGNSPMIPDGWVMVPVEPTEEMMLHKSGCQHHAWDDQDCAMRQTRRLIWSHMLAAAQQQEVK